MGGIDFAGLFKPIIAFFKQPPKDEIQNLKEADHSYIRGHETQRSPCPFLNSLANHGYLPRDGKNITQDKLKAALIVAGNCSHTLADVLSSIVKPVLHEDDTFTLVDLRRHNAIEHDSSFTRLDFRQGDNYSFQPDMFHAFLADAEGGPITKESLARTRARRDKEEKEARVPGLGLRLWVTTWSQTCILLQTFGESISVKDITQFYVEERLPEWWLKGHPQMTFPGLLSDIGAVFWRHLFVRVPETTLKDPLRGW